MRFSWQRILTLMGTVRPSFCTLATPERRETGFQLTAQGLAINLGNGKLGSSNGETATLGH